MAKEIRKKHVRPKSEVAVMHISQPFDFSHDIHVGHEDFEERLVGTRPASPPPPCPGCKDTFGDSLIPVETISNRLKEEIIPALRLEVGDIVKSTITSLLNDETKKSTIPHCQTCCCSEKDRRNDRSSSTDMEPENSYVKEAGDTSYLFDRPTPCTAVIVEDINIKEILSGMKRFTVSEIKDSVDEERVNNSVSNPVYYQKEQTFLMQTQQGTKLVKFGSDIQLKHDELHSLVLAPSHTLPGLTTKDQSPEMERDEIQKYPGGRPSSKFDQRDCMAHALQWHIGDLVDGIVFDDSVMLDSLLADGCFTEEECSGVRKKPDRQDQVRFLISIIKGRDLNILERFLRNIRSHNGIVAERIAEKFEQNVKEGMRCSKCALCKLTTQVNLKYIVDSLWRHSLIEDGLFNLIVETDKPIGAQCDLWHQVIHSLNSHNPPHVRNVLVKALTVKQHYHHIAQGVEWVMNANGELMCRCEIQKNMLLGQSSTSLVSSWWSIPTSDSEFVADSQSDTSRVSSKKTENATVIETSRESIHKTFVKDVSQADIIPNQTFQSRPDAKVMQQPGPESDKQGNSDKLKPPVASRKKCSEWQKAFIGKLETSEV